MSATVDLDLARQVRVGIQPFTTTFERAQAGRDPVIRFDSAVPPDLTPEEAVATAFAHARADGWLNDLCAQCIVDRIVTREFLLQAARQTAGVGQLAAQALVNQNSRFKDTVLEAEGLLYVADFVCRIEIGGSHKGTGFLVRPDMVMTADHVIASLVGPGGAVLPDSATALQVIFDDKIEMISGRRTRKPRSFGVMSNWLVTRGGAAVVAGVASVDSATPDYAVIQLDSTPLPLPFGLTLSKNDSFADDPLLIVQHPGGQPMSHDDGKVLLPDAVTQVFTHNVSALPGSSGAPCFNDVFEVVGIHSGEKLGAVPQCNAALAIATPAKILAQIPPSTGLAPRYQSQMPLANGEVHPVLGREETQDWRRLSLADGKLRILAVSPVASRKVGMSFTADLVASDLPADQHRLIRLSAEKFRNDSPQDFARKLFAGAGAPATLALPAGPDADTTRDAWLRYTFVPEVLTRLDGLRDGRAVWLVLDDLRETLADGTGLRECLDLLYAGIIDRPWLRILLLGYGATPTPEVGAMMQRITLPPISITDFEAFVRARLAVLSQAEQKAVLAQFTRMWAFLPKLPVPDQLDYAADVVTGILTGLT